MFPQFLHVGPNEHLTELDEITVRLVVDFNHSPGVGTASDLSTVGGGYDRVGTDYCEWDLALEISYGRCRSLGAYDDLFVLLDSLFVLILVGRRLKDSDTMVVDIGEDLPLAPLHCAQRADSPSA